MELATDTCEPLSGRVLWIAVIRLDDFNLFGFKFDEDKVSFASLSYQSLYLSQPPPQLSPFAIIQSIVALVPCSGGSFIELKSRGIFL